LRRSSRARRKSASSGATGSAGVGPMAQLRSTSVTGGAAANPAPSFPASAPAPRSPARPTSSASASSWEKRSGRRKAPRLLSVKPLATSATLRLLSHGL
jgi:hypothetical protein